LADALACDKDILAHLRLDFSVVNNMKYYSGIVFQGFIEGNPTSVLSGGRYDHLMHRMGQDADAIGFAVYPELLQRLSDDEQQNYDADVLLLYCENDDPAIVCRAVRALTEAGERVLTAHEKPEKLTFRRTLRMAQGGVVADEAHD
jgi:ATP phosphoribosyltransferase regulatory subunit